MTPEELLLKAADDIAENGHHKGSYFAGEGRTGAACALGALDRAAWGATRGVRYSYATERVLSEAIGLLVKQCGSGLIPRWNDAPGTTAEDVILTLKKAANHD